MTQILEAWLEGHRVGQFILATNQPVPFVYDDDATATPISLSLPRDGSASKLAAQRFLDNLLPDAEHTRTRMALAYDAADTSTHGLLAKAGGDLAGGLVLLPEGTAISNAGLTLNPILDDRDLADRSIASNTTQMRGSLSVLRHASHSRGPKESLPWQTSMVTGTGPTKVHLQRTL